MCFPEPQENKLEHWQNREITADEHVAAIKIQKVWRGFYVRKVKTARTPGKFSLCFFLCDTYSWLHFRKKQGGLSVLGPKTLCISSPISLLTMKWRTSSSNCYLYAGAFVKVILLNNLNNLFCFRYRCESEDPRTVEESLGRIRK